MTYNIFYIIEARCLFQNFLAGRTHKYFYVRYLRSSLKHAVEFSSLYSFLHVDIPHEILDSTFLKGSVIQIQKALINNQLRAWKVSRKFYIPNNYNFAAMYPWNWLFS